MAERLGTGLQNLVQRFDSAWHLQKAPAAACRGFIFRRKAYIRSLFVMAQTQESDQTFSAVSTMSMMV